MKNKIILTEEEVKDFKNLMKFNSNNVLNMISNNNSKKLLKLSKFYFKPYLLYQSSFLTEYNMNDFIEFVIYRYNVEINELDLYLEQGIISREKYDFYKENLESNYFNNNPIGINIKRIKDKKNNELVKTLWFL